jgi:hypothetical protein
VDYSRDGLDRSGLLVVIPSTTVVIGLATCAATSAAFASKASYDFSRVCLYYLGPQPRLSYWRIASRRVELLAFGQQAQL